MTTNYYMFITPITINKYIFGLGGGGWGFASINHGYKSKKIFSFENELKAAKNPRVMPISGL